MACGCAVVEAKVPSVEIWMEDDSENCMLVEPNPRGVAEALIKLVRDSQMRDRIATNGEKFVATISSTWEQSCEQMEKILLEAVFRDAAPGAKRDYSQLASRSTDNHYQIADCARMDENATIAEHQVR